MATISTLVQFEVYTDAFGALGVLRQCAL